MAHWSLEGAITYNYCRSWPFASKRTRL